MYTAATFADAAERIARLRRGAGQDVVLAYSVKTSPAAELLGLARDRGMWAEAIAQTEVLHALALGFPSEHIILNGPGKWWPSPSKVPAYGAVFCDSLAELRASSRAVANGDLRTHVFGLRLRPATVASRFGIALHDPKAFSEVVRLLRRLPRRQGLGLHFHIASSMVGVRTWQALAVNFLGAAGVLSESLHDRPLTLSFGGGWHPDDWPVFLRTGFPELVAQCRRRLPMVRRIVLEPGKALSQRAMCLVVRVLEVRRSRWGTELIVDGSVAELPDIRSHTHRVVSCDASGHVTVWGAGRDRVLGRLCMEYDILSEAVQAPRGIRAGHLLAYLDAGAYDASMAYSFGRGGVPVSAHLGMLRRSR
jgi:diaminopimelate decarboxylase